MADYIVYRDDSLYHHGIKGQKWGVRRYENPDGTLTLEGQKRYYGKRFERESRKQQRLNFKADQEKQVRLAKDHASKAKRGAIIGLLGAGMAGAGYLETELGKAMNGGKTPFGQENITIHDKYGTRNFTNRPKGALLFEGGLMDMGVGGAIAVVGVGKAAYHGVKAAVASRRASVAGHTKAAEKAKKHLEGMKEMFANTMYSDLVKERFG